VPKPERKEMRLVRESIETDTTRATARLPGLEIEIVHRRPADDVEQISINLQAVPSFQAFDDFFGTLNPFAFWARAARMAWLPWLEAARTMTPPFTDVRRLSSRWTDSRDNDA
jgi:hypothetical protein